MPRGIEDQVVHANTFTVLPSEIKESAFDVSGTALHDWSFAEEQAQEQFATRQKRV